MANVTHYNIDYMSSSNKPWVACINCYDQSQGEAGGSRIATLRFLAAPFRRADKSAVSPLSTSRSRDSET
jgi:hypothetical protein